MREGGGGGRYDFKSLDQRLIFRSGEFFASEEVFVSAKLFWVN